MPPSSCVAASASHCRPRAPGPAFFQPQLFSFCVLPVFCSNTSQSSGSNAAPFDKLRAGSYSVCAASPLPETPWNYKNNYIYLLINISYDCCYFLFEEKVTKENSRNRNARINPQYPSKIMDRYWGKKPYYRT